MPTIFRLFGYLFQFYSNDHEPIHIHVLKGGAMAKYSLSPVTLIENNGMRPAELKLIESIIEENQEIIATRWNEFFNNAQK